MEFFWLSLGGPWDVSPGTHPVFTPVPTQHSLRYYGCLKEACD